MEIKKIASVLALYAGISFSALSYQVSAKQENPFYFSPKNTELHAIVSDKPQYYPYFISKAKKQFGNDIEFIVNGTFFDVQSGKSIGKIVESHQRITNGIWEGGVDLIDYGGLFVIDDTINPVFNPKFRMGGFAWLVKNHIPNYELSYYRNIDFYSARRRTAFGVDYNGNLLVYFATLDIKEMAKRMDEFDCKNAVVGDGGSSALVYGYGKFKAFPARKLKSVVVGVRKTDYSNCIMAFIKNVVEGLELSGFRRR